MGNFGICGISVIYNSNETLMSTRLPCDTYLAASYQNSSNIALLAAPLLLIQIANFTYEAESAIRLSESMTTGQFREGVAKTLRPYRQQVNNIFRNLEGTSANQCASFGTSVYLYDTTFTSNTTQVRLENSSKVIADIYSEAVHKCTEGPIRNLRAKISKLDALKKQIQSEYVDNVADAAIRECQSADKWTAANECYPKFIDGFTSLLTNFTKILNPGQTQNVTDIFSLNYSDQDLFFLSKCLGYANIDAALAANIILNEIQSCAAAKGVTVPITQISVLEPTQILTSLYNTSLLANYNATKLNTSSDIHKVLVNYLNHEIKSANEEKVRYPSTPEEYLALNNLNMALITLSNETFRNCLANAYNYTKDLLVPALETHLACAENYLTEATNLLASLNASFPNLRSEPNKSNPLATKQACVSLQLNSTITYNGCHYTGVTTDSADIAYQKVLDAVIQRYRQNTNAESCRLKATIYERIDSCNSGFFLPIY